MIGHIFYRYFKYILIMAESLFLIIWITFAIHIISHTQNEKTGQRTEYFTSIQVNYGESLWEISRRYYSSEYKSMNHYIKRIMDLNHMQDSNIKAGAFLIIPYYDTQASDTA